MTLRRASFCAGIAALVALAGPFAVPAAAAEKTPRLCFMTFDPSTLQTNRYGAFFQALSELGYSAGKTIAIDYLSADGHGERFPALAEECLRRGADVIAVSTTPATQAAKAATLTVPIVMIGIGVDPTEIGLVASLARPGGNITGQSSLAPGLAAKRLQLLAELVPGLSRVGVLAYLADPIAAPQIKELEEAAAPLRLKLQVRDIRSSEDLAAAFADLAKEGAEALLTTTESIFFVLRGRVIELAARYRMPNAHAHLAYAREGGLMAYSQNRDDVYKRAALQIDKILKGAKPADLPIEQPTHFELVINLKAARELGVEVPPSILARADEVIE